MMIVKKLYDVKPAPVNVEMDISLLEIRRDRLPYRHLRMQFFNFTPGCISYSFTVCFGGYKQKVKISPVSVDLDDRNLKMLEVKEGAGDL